MAWLSVKKIASESGVPERTIRFYIAEGRVNARKEGRAWLCEVKTLKNVGIHLEGYPAESKKVTATAVTAVKSTATGNNNGKKKKRTYQTLEDLGVYKDLLKLWRDSPLKENESMFHLMKICMEQIALGFYEFHPHRKVNFFRNAKEALVKTIVSLKLIKKPTTKESEWHSHLENEILSGVTGLIIKAEKRESGK